MGDRGLSTLEPRRWGTDVGVPFERNMGGVLASILSCESMHVNECIWQARTRMILGYLFFRWIGPASSSARIVAIADHGTFSARGTGAVHRAVQRLRARRQAREGARRHASSTAPTADSPTRAPRVVERARRILHEIDDIAADMASLDDDVSGDARIGVIGTTARWLMPQLLGGRRPRPSAGPHDRLRGQHHHAHPGVLSGQLNAAIVHLPIDDPELMSTRCSPRTCW